MKLKKKIYYHNTDAGGVVYYAEYLKFLEEARTEYFAHKGVSVKELADGGILFVVCRQEIDYKLPAYYGDMLEVDTKISSISRATVDFECEIRNQKNEVVCLAKTVLVCINQKFKPVSIPEEVKSKIS